jgi:hypothetical protein
MWAASATGIRELDRRTNHGVDVRLLWHSPTDRVFIAVEEDAGGESFELEVDAANALDAFRHPYVYADWSDDDHAITMDDFDVGRSPHDRRGVH